MDAPPVHYVKTSDGFSIGYSVCGEGVPLVLVPEAISHIQIYWTADTLNRPWLQGLAARFRLILYDGRGQGMSSRGLLPNHSMTDEVRDLEAVIDDVGLDRVVLLSRSHAAIRYTLEHPQRVSALILVAVPADGAAWANALAVGIAEHDWDLFLNTLAGLASPGDIPGSIERLRQCMEQQDWLARARAASASDATGLLPQLRLPVLVLHPRDYHVVGLDESRKVAASIAGAEILVLSGSNSKGDPEQGVAAIEGFLRRRVPDGAARVPEVGPLSDREQEVLRLVAAGKSNQQIADDLVISLNTVRRHVSNIFDKTGAANRAQAALYARDHGLA